MVIGQIRHVAIKGPNEGWQWHRMAGPVLMTRTLNKLSNPILINSHRPSLLFSHTKKQKEIIIIIIKH